MNVLGWCPCEWRLSLQMAGPAVPDVLARRPASPLPLTPPPDASPLCLDAPAAAACGAGG